MSPKKFCPIADFWPNLESRNDFLKFLLLSPLSGAVDFQVLPIFGFLKRKSVPCVRFWWNWVFERVLCSLFWKKNNLANFDHFFDYFSYQNKWGLPLGRDRVNPCRQCTKNPKISFIPAPRKCINFTNLLSWTWRWSSKSKSCKNSA